MQPPILSVKYNPRAVSRKRRLGSLGNSCVNTSAAAAAAAAAPAIHATAVSPAASTQSSLAAQAAAAASRARSLRGMGWLGAAAPASTGDAILNAGGITGQGGATGAVMGAAKGAAVGSAIFPGIGTAIGAAIGAIAGGLIHTSSYSNWLVSDTQIIAQMKQIPAGFQGRTLSNQTLMEMWSAVVVTGAMYAYVSPNPGHSPSDMQNEYQWVMAWMATILQCMNANPVGASLTVSVATGNGVTFTLSFKNPGSANSSVVAQTVMIPAYLAWCTHNGAVDTQSNHCPGDASNPINQLLLTLMTDFQIAAYPPPANQGGVTPAATSTVQPVVTPAKTATVTVATPATPTAPAASTTVTAGKATTVATLPATPVSTASSSPAATATIPTSSAPAAGAAPVLPTGYGYNYAGSVVPIPAGYTLAPNGYIMDSGGYILASANDDQLTAPTSTAIPATAETSSPVINVSVPGSTSDTPAAVAAAPDNTMLYVGMAALAALIYWKETKK